jgi:hypothetical protein
MATILFGLSFIPGHQLAKELKGAYTLSKLGKEGVVELSKKVASNTATESEKKILKNTIEEIVPEIDTFTKLTRKQLVKQIIIGLTKKSLKFVLNFILGLSKFVGGLLKDIVIPISGLYYTFDEIYLAVFSGDVEAMKIRENSKIQKLVSLIRGDEEKIIKEKLIEEINKKIEILKSSDSLIYVQGSEESNKKYLDSLINKYSVDNNEKNNVKRRD